MRDVAIVGVGFTSFGRLAIGLNASAVLVCREALADASVPLSRIQGSYLGNFVGGQLADHEGLASVSQGGDRWC